MVAIKHIAAAFTFLFAAATTVAMSHGEVTDALEARAEALETRAEQLQDLATVYRRALSSLDELAERGNTPSKPSASVNLICHRSVGPKYCDRAKQMVLKAYAKNKDLHKFKNGEIFVAGAPQEVVRVVSCAFYNEAKRPLSAPSISVNMMN